MKRIAMVLFAFALGAAGAWAQSFPADFAGTWKRDTYANTLTFTANTVKASNSDSTWTLRAVSGASYRMNNGGAT